MKTLILLCATAVIAGCATTGAGTIAQKDPYPQFCQPCVVPCIPMPGCYPKAAAPAPAPVAAKRVEPTAAPTFSPPGGTFATPQTVSITSATPGAVIYCTTDGSEPTAGSPECAGPVALASGTTTVKAMATSAGAGASAASTATYVIEPPPPAKPARVAVTKEKIELKEKVFFDAGKTTIKSESFGLLDEAAEVLKSHPEIGKVVVEGHTDSAGAAAFNQKLSQGRATAVAKYLEGKGVVASRLEAKGYGETRPVADNKTAQGREANRRVELTIAH